MQNRWLLFSKHLNRWISALMRSVTTSSFKATYLLLFFFMLFCSAGNNTAENKKWISLFNGKDLTGWIVKITGHDLNENFQNTFLVDHGVLKVSYADYENFEGEFGHLFYYQKLSHYRLRVEYRFVGEQAPGGPDWAYRNSGIMLHSQAPETMLRDQRFPVSIEAQLLGGDGTHERTTANVCTPGTHIVMDGNLITNHCTDSRSNTYHGDQWVTGEVEVHGDSLIRHIINGNTVLEYTRPQLDESDPDAQRLIENDHGIRLKEGYICLQAESHPVEFRRVELMELNE
jgi:hypothetical protein